MRVKPQLLSQHYRDVITARESFLYGVNIIAGSNLNRGKHTLHLAIYNIYDAVKPCLCLVHHSLGNEVQNKQGYRRHCQQYSKRNPTCET